MSETQMEASVFYTQQEFRKYGEKVDGKYVLNKEQLNKLLTEQLPNLFKDPKKPKASEATTQASVEKMWKAMDYAGEELCTLDVFLRNVANILSAKYI